MITSRFTHQDRRPVPKFALAMSLALGLLLAACGGSPETAATTTTATDAGAAVAEAATSDGNAAASEAAPNSGSIEERAAETIASLQPGSHPFDTEVVDTADGSKTTLRDQVDGDRPVLIWFYAPH